MIETWRKCLDENKIVGATLMDLSKAFNCLPHDLLVEKIKAYGLDTKTLKLILSYLSGRKQCVKIRISFGLLKLNLSDIPHGSLLEPIFFNIFISDIFFLLGSDLHNFADHDTVTAVAETIRTNLKLLCLLKLIIIQLVLGLIHTYESSLIDYVRLCGANHTFADSSTLARW